MRRQERRRALPFENRCTFRRTPELYGAGGKLMVTTRGELERSSSLPS